MQHRKRDHADLDADQVRRVVLATGRVVYDLEAEREKRGEDGVAIVRLEQYHPLPTKEIASALRQYPKAELVWVQDEPVNQGAWPYVCTHLPQALREVGEERPIRVVGRPESAAPSSLSPTSCHRFGS